MSYGAAVRGRKIVDLGGRYVTEYRTYRRDRDGARIAVGIIHQRGFPGAVGLYSVEVAADGTFEAPLYFGERMLRFRAEEET